MSETTETNAKMGLPALLRSARNAYGAAIRKALAEAGCDDVPRNGMYVIGAIAENMELDRIIRGLGTSKQAASQLVDILVLRGYLIRAPNQQDRRRHVLTLTEHGSAATAATRATLDRIQAEVETQLGAEHVAHTRATLWAIIRAGTPAEET